MGELAIDEKKQTLNHEPEKGSWGERPVTPHVDQAPAIIKTGRSNEQRCHTSKNSFEITGMLQKEIMMHHAALLVR